jgi:hypothetical protein
MLVLFKPWRTTDPNHDVGPLTWNAFCHFVADLRASPSLLAAHTLAAMDNLANGLSCSKAEQVAQSKYRVRNSDIWGAAGVERPGQAFRGGEGGSGGEKEMRCASGGGIARSAASARKTRPSAQATVRCLASL